MMIAIDRVVMTEVLWVMGHGFGPGPPPVHCLTRQVLVVLSGGEVTYCVESSRVVTGVWGYMHLSAIQLVCAPRLSLRLLHTYF